MRPLPVSLSTVMLLSVIACAPVPPEGGKRNAVPEGGKRDVPPEGGKRNAVALTYPEVARSDHVDTYFGALVAAPYRPLEDLASDAVRALVADQNALAKPYLEAIPSRRKLIKRMTELWSYARSGVPRKHGGRYFFEANDGTQEQDVLMVAESLDDEPRLLIDPNTFSEDATVAVVDWEASPDGTLVAYATSDGGTDWKTWRLREVESGRELDDVVRHMKFSGVAWSADSAGFYYSRYPLGDDGEADGSKQIAVHYHRVGSPQSEDSRVFGIDDDSGHDPYPVVTDDGRYLLFNVFEGYDVNGVYYRDLDGSDSEVVRLLDDWDALYTFLGNLGRELYFSTTREAPNGRVVAIDLDRPRPEDWRQVVAESEHALNAVHLVGERIVAEYLVDARSRVRLFELDGREAGDVELPGIGTAGGFDGKLGDPETFFELDTFIAPPGVYRLDVPRAGVSSFRIPQTSFDSGAYVTEQVFFSSKDGTRVPMFLIHRPGLTRDGQNPTMLYGYGGFNVSETPEFKVRWAMWLEMGGVLAVANLRGGNEYGEAWHQAGGKTRTQNVFDDFIAAAEWLIAEQVTRAPRLAIHGRSNGGLLVAAVLNQRPELFGVALPAVGVLDMLRYHTASANAYQWGSDYGWSENDDEFKALRAYSPVHNVGEGICYPPTLVTTADRDDRVVPWHSYKFTAALQHAQACDQPILLRIETRAGHGGVKPTWMKIEDYADQWAFAAKHLGMQIEM